MKLKFHHIGIPVRNLDNAIKFYIEVLGYKLLKTGPYSTIYKVDQPGYRIKYVLLSMPSADDNWTELVEPEEGPWLDFMEEKGEGTIREICFKVDDIEEAYDEFKKRGLTPVDRLGSPLETKYVASPSGAKFIYLPTEETHGTVIEILERP